MLASRDLTKRPCRGIINYGKARKEGLEECYEHLHDCVNTYVPICINKVEYSLVHSYHPLSEALLQIHSFVRGKGSLSSLRAFGG